MDSHLDIMEDTKSHHLIRARPLTKNMKKNRKVYEKRKRAKAEDRERRPLLVKEFKQQIVDAVDKNQVVIITAETGSGKSSQVPQILLHGVLKDTGIIACTQPRRIAARSLAERVASEMGVCVGAKVGYHVRFDNKTTPETQIKYMTDGILLRQCLFSRDYVNKYDIIIIDEIHERNLQMDLLLGYLKQILSETPKLSSPKLVIMSATIDTDKLAEFFSVGQLPPEKHMLAEGTHQNHIQLPPVLRLEGKMKYPVDIEYKPGHSIEHIVNIIMLIVKKHPDGEILVFLPGKPEIYQVTNELKKVGRSLYIVPVHSYLPPWKIDKIFDDAPDGQRKVILSTNIAESSITLKNLRYVVDTGYVNVKIFDGLTGVNVLETRLISKAEAQQRRGRVGRTGPGKVYRLYDKKQLKGGVKPEVEGEKVKETDREFQEFPTPQIERDDLTHVVLMLKKSDYKEISDFPWLTEPNKSNVTVAIQDLVRLCALRKDDLRITEFGLRLVQFPLHPRMAAVILHSENLGRPTGYRALCLASMLSAFNGRQGSLRKFSKDKGYDEQSRDEVQVLVHIMQDLLALVGRNNYYQGEEEEEEEEEDQIYQSEIVEETSRKHKISSYFVFEAIYVYNQLAEILRPPKFNRKTKRYQKVRYQQNQLDAAIDITEPLSGVFISNIAKRDKSGELKVPGGITVEFNPTLKSAASNSSPSCVGGTEIFCLSDVRNLRKFKLPELVNTFVPKE